ncbi:hypothetical protein ACNSOL_11625 (plasmid) [Aliarcobacter lanthieri]|uniref:hypothetical protein n=1 Tax=Aliarcobacter lanthieri TaxID=1355374 RepID=UPI003AAAFF4F
MEIVVKKFDKNSGSFISSKIELSEIIKNNPSTIKGGSFNLTRFRQNIFLDQKDIDIINSLKRYIDNFDFSFFNIYRKNTNTKLFRDKLYALDRKMERFLQVKNTKDNLAIQNAINSFKEELRGYKALKNTILKELSDFKYQKRQMNYLTFKRFCENRKKSYSFGLASYGSVLAISKGRRNSR